MVNASPYRGHFPPRGLVACLTAILWLFLAGCEKPLKRKLMMALEQNATVERGGILYDVAKDKVLDGYVKERAENGRVTFLYAVREGKREGISLAWHENGLLSLQGSFRDGKEDGLWTTWFDNGNKRWEGHRQNGIKHGAWTMWREGGQKKSEGFYENDLKEGREIVWHMNGRIWQRRSYRKGMKQGRWIYWDNQGRLIQEEVFRGNELIDSKKLPDFWLQDKDS